MYKLELNEKEVKSIGINRWIEKHKHQVWIYFIAWLVSGIVVFTMTNDVATGLWMVLGVIYVIWLLFNSNKAGKKFLSNTQDEQRYYSLTNKGVHIVKGVQVNDTEYSNLKTQ